MQFASSPYMGMIPVAYHVYVNGSYYWQDEQAAWAFVVIVDDVMGILCLMGFAYVFLF